MITVKHYSTEDGEAEITGGSLEDDCTKIIKSPLLNVVTDVIHNQQFWKTFVSTFFFFYCLKVKSNIFLTYKRSHHNHDFRFSKKKKKKSFQCFNVFFFFLSHDNKKAWLLVTWHWLWWTKSFPNISNITKINIDFFYRNNITKWLLSCSPWLHFNPQKYKKKII